MGMFTDLFPKKKPKKGGLALPSFLRAIKSGSDISDARKNRTNEDLTQIRYGQTTEEIVRNYMKNAPDVSHAAETTMRFMITDKYTIVAKDLETDTVNPEATKQMQAFAARLDKLPTFYDGFSPQSSFASISESLVLQLLGNGSCASELVLDKALLPSHIQTISTNSLKYRSGGDRVVPYIKDSGGEIVLDSPAVNIISLSQDPETAYATSWYKAAVQSIVSSAEFTNDLRNSFRKASLPRLTAEIAIDKFKETLSPEVLFDPKKFKQVLDSTISSIEDQLNGLNPEDAVVNFDVVKVDHLSAGNNSNHDNVDTHAGIVNGQMSTGLHTLPSILGRGESQSTASTETVLFLKIVESLQNRLNEIFSYHLTTAARLQGLDVVVTFKYSKPSLRPEIEEESFMAMKQSRILELLSFGFLSDEEASVALTGDLPAEGFTPLSGTQFYQSKQGSDGSEENAYSNTSVSGKGVNNTKDQKDRNKGNSKPKSNKTTGK